MLRGVAACKDSNGVPTLVPFKCRVLGPEIAAGDHYELIEGALDRSDYEGPFVIIDADDMQSMVEPLRSIFLGSTIDWKEIDIIDLDRVT